MPGLMLTWPRVTRCGCGGEILLACRAGEELAVDAVPVLPETVCGACRGKGRRAVPQHAGTKGRGGGPFRVYMPGDLYGRMVDGEITSCPDCAGTGLRGAPITDLHVVVSADGEVRGTRAEPFDAFHRVHQCAVMDLLSAA